MENLEPQEQEQPQEQTKQALVKLSVTDQMIAEYKGYMEYTIGGIDDKAGFVKVFEARQLVKKSRVLVAKEAKKLNEDALAWQRKVNNRKNEVIAELETIEAHLQKQEDIVEAEKERIRKEKIDAERARIQGRIDKLGAYGFTIDYTEVQQATDAEFESKLLEAKQSFEKDAEDKKERDRLEAEETERLRLEKEAEDLRLKSERAELEKKQKELKAQQDEFAQKQKEFHDSVAKAAREKKEKEEQEERDRKANEKKIQDEKDRVDKEAKLKKEADEKAIKDQEEKERLEKEQEIERLAQLTDHDKLNELWEAINAIEMPNVQSHFAEEIISEVSARLKRCLLTIKPQP